MNKYATFFGGGIKNTESIEYNDTIKIGKLLSEKGYIIKSGGYYGLMEAISKGVNEVNGYSIGYTCKVFKSTKGNKYLNETIVSKTLFDRLNHLIIGSELFIVQKGGVGTLSEIILLLDIIRKEEIKPLIYVIGEEWYTVFLNIKNVIGTDLYNIIVFCDNYDDLLIKLK
jgi:uncharacterized protein (TIGR00725 family)